VLNQLTIPKFAKIFILLLKLDNLTFDAHGAPVREWPTAMADLVSLPNCTSDVEQQKVYIRFIVKTMNFFEEEIVDRCQQKTVADMNNSN